MDDNLSPATTSDTFEMETGEVDPIAADALALATKKTYTRSILDTAADNAPEVTRRYYDHLGKVIDELESRKLQDMPTHLLLRLAELFGKWLLPMAKEAAKKDNPQDFRGATINADTINILVAKAHEAKKVSGKARPAASRVILRPPADPRRFTSAPRRT
jgi:hypothetical protein